MLNSATIYNTQYNFDIPWVIVFSMDNYNFDIDIYHANYYNFTHVIQQFILITNIFEEKIYGELQWNMATN